MFTAITAAIIVAMVLMLTRAVLGPTVYDRVLAVNSFGTKTVLLLAVLGFLMGRPAFLDIALLYCLINFIGTIAILKFFRYGRLEGAMVDEDPLAEDFR
jgi:multicomponent Na+:H+ antiporter subunit F